jgi:alcohol dehydrogenase class IV
MNFEFVTTTRIIFGNNKLKLLKNLAPNFGSRAFVITGNDPDRSAEVLDMLDAANCSPVIYSVPGEPTLDTINRGLFILVETERDFVVSVGGGSAIDTGKALAVLATNDGAPADYLDEPGKGRLFTNPSLPLVAIPTTAGSGAEITSTALFISPEPRSKVRLHHNAMFPRIALIDPKLTLSVPPNITAYTGLAALCHNLEVFVSPKGNPITDILTKDGLRRGSLAIQRAYTDSADIESRTSLAMSSLYAGLSAANASLGATHTIANAIGGLFNAPYGVICAQLLPAVIETNIRAMQERMPENVALRKYDQITRIVAGKEHSKTLAAFMQTLNETFAIPSLSSYGIQQTDFDNIIAYSKSSPNMTGNPVELNEDELRAILGKAM